MIALKKIAPFIVILFGFAMRAYAMDTTWIDGDRANPHGIGVVILDAFFRGDWSRLPLFSDLASVGLPNPPLISYVFAIVGLADRSLFVATALGLMASTVAIAATFGIGKRFFGWEVGLLSATLLAASNWGVYLARGTWHPAHMEVSFAVTAWLLMTGVAHSGGSRKRLFAGFVAAALTAGTYLVNFIVLVQAPVATLVASAWRPLPSLRRGWLVGIGVCAVAFMCYALALTLDGQLSSLTNPVFLRAQTRVLSEAELTARGISPMNREPLGHFVRLANGSDYALIWTNPEHSLYDVRQTLTQVRAYLVTFFVLLGLAWMLVNMRQAANRFLLVWAAIPIIALLGIVYFKRGDFGVQLYYLLTTAPVPYLAGGIGIGLIVRALRARVTAAIALCVALVVVPTWNFVATAQTVYAQPFMGIPDFMPLRWSQKLGNFWRAECQQFDVDDRWWAHRNWRAAVACVTTIFLQRGRSFRRAGLVRSSRLELHFQTRSCCHSH